MPCLPNNVKNFKVLSRLNGAHIMKLSMMTYTMARQGYDVEDFIKTATDCRLDGIDWVTTYGRDPKELRKMSHDAGLPVVCHTFFLHKLARREQGWLDEVKESLENAVILEASVVMIPPRSHPDITDRTICRREWIEVLQQVVPLAEAAGVIATVENYPGKQSPFVTAEDFFEAQAEVPQLRLTYDNGNAASGENPAGSFRQCAAYVAHAHFKDWDIADKPMEGYHEMLDGGYYRAALIGEGNVDTAACWRTMKEHAYDGYINIEYEGNKYKADEAVRRAAELLRSL